MVEIFRSIAYPYFAGLAIIFFALALDSIEILEEHTASRKRSASASAERRRELVMAAKIALIAPFVPALALIGVVVSLALELAGRDRSCSRPLYEPIENWIRGYELQTSEF